MTGFNGSGDHGPGMAGPGPSPDRAEADEDDLAVSLAGVSSLVTDTLALDVLLTHVAEFAVGAIPGADGAGVTLLERGRPDTIVASAPFVRAVDEIQYTLGEGPCISAASAGRTFRSGSLGGEALWPRFGPRVGRLGVHSVLSLPLLLPDARRRGNQRLCPRQGRVR